MQEDQKDFERILEKYLDGRATQEEKALLADYFEKAGPFPAHQLSEAEMQHMQVAFRQSQQKNTAARTRIPLYRRIPAAKWWAAAACMMLAVSIWVFFLNRKQIRELAFIEVRTAQGETKLLKLPDSSEITLNANTTLQYAAAFREDRRLSLSGEAFFKVTKDSAHPFRIQLSDSLQVEVVGTSFNINSYQQSSSTSVLVTEGIVKVHQAAALLGTLTRNKQIMYNKTSGQALFKTLDRPVENSWITGVWKYDGMSIADLTLLLNNQFGITLVNKTGKELTVKTDASLNFSRQQSPQEIVTVFCSVSPYKSTWINNQTVELR